MNTDLVTVAVAEGVATVVLNRPEALNALSMPLVAALTSTLDRLESDPAAKVILLAGAGRHFAAGADIGEMLDMTVAEVAATDFAGCCTRLVGCAKPIIAAVQGAALGGGCELVEMCDVVIAAESARFGHPEITLATMPGAGGTQRLPRAMGKAKALDLLLTGRTMAATEAERAGLVSRVVADAALMDEALAVARRIAGFSAPVLRAVKQAVGAAFRTGLDDGLLLERSLFHLTFATADRREGMAAFLAKRPPHWADR